MAGSEPPEEGVLPDVDIDDYERSLLRRQRRWALATIAGGVPCIALAFVALVSGRIRGALWLGLVGVAALTRGVARWRSLGLDLAALGGARRP